MVNIKITFVWDVTPCVLDTASVFSEEVHIQGASPKRSSCRFHVESSGGKEEETIDLLHLSSYNLVI